MALYYVEIKEELTYHVTVEAEDYDDAWDEALKTRKYQGDDFDDSDTTCVSVHEVPADQIEYAEVDEQ